MNSFLSKILRLDSVLDVILLSLHGEPLFCGQASSAAVDKEIALWAAITSDLGKPKTAEFLFSTGRYYLHFTEVGFLIVGMSHSSSNKKIRAACTKVQEKLSDWSVRKKVLLKMLSDGEDAVKPHLVNALIPLADAEVAQVLLPFLQQGEQFHPNVREKLFISLCKALGNCAFNDAIQPLKKLLLTSTSDTNEVGSDIRAAARIAIQQLESARLGKAKAGSNTSERDLSIPAENSVKADKPDNSVDCSDNSSPEEQRIKELLGQDQKRQAIFLLMQLITSNAKRKRFRKAEQLRDWLLRIDSMVLVESIRAAEIIEEEKRASISDEYMLTWKELRNTFSSEEFSGLYHAMSQRSYGEGEMVVKQGESLPVLFFVNSGHVHLYVVSQGREMLLKDAGPGEVVGGETFFDVSVWTVNAVSKGADLSLLTMQQLQSQKDLFPSMHLKLQSFCAKFSSPNSLFKKTNRNRRRLERKTLSGRVTIDLLDQQGKDTGLGTKGELIDLSKGGVAFSLRFSKKKNATTLFGQKIRVSIRSDGSVAPFVRNGKVVAVRCHDFIGNDYSIHVEFDKELSVVEMQQATGKIR